MMRNCDVQKQGECYQVSYWAGESFRYRQFRRVTTYHIVNSKTGEKVDKGEPYFGWERIEDVLRLLETPYEVVKESFHWCHDWMEARHLTEEKKDAQDQREGQ